MSVPAAAESEAKTGSAWFGLNRATLAVLVATAGLGLSEELWRNFLPVHLKELAGGVDKAVGFVGVYACLLNFVEGFGYILGGVIAHRLGARVALTLSALPMLVGFGLLMATQDPWTGVLGALLLTNWEPLSVPAAFDVIGTEAPKGRKTIAFALQSIQKRIPKLIGPVLGGLALGAIGFWLNLSLALGVLVVAVLLQVFLLKRLKPKPDPAPVPVLKLLREIPPDLRMLLTAEILLRWGEWFVRDFAVLYVVDLLGRSGWTERHATETAGLLVSLTALTALATYLPMSSLIDRSPSAKPYIGVTFFLFALFPFALVLLPKTGMPLWAALGIAFVINGLRELGEPARKAMIAAGFAPEVRARAIGWYWGLRSLAFFPAPIVGAWVWQRMGGITEGPATGTKSGAWTGGDYTFLLGGCIGLLGTAWFWLRVRCTKSEPTPRP